MRVTNKWLTYSPDKWVLYTTNEGRLRFGDKRKASMKIDSDSLQIREANYIEIFDVEENSIESSENYMKDI